MVRSQGLDHAAEAIAEIRGSMNRLRQDEAAELQPGAPPNAAEGRPELPARRRGARARFGEEKLRVRTSSSQATAEVVEEGTRPGGRPGAASTATSGLTCSRARMSRKRLYRASTTYEYPKLAPDTVRAEIVATSAAIAAQRALREARRVFRAKRPSSIVVFLEVGAEVAG